MKLEDLATVLTQFGVDPHAFGIGNNAKEGVYCLTSEADGWHCFFLERGLRVDERLFNTEWEASDAFISLIAADPQTRSQACRFPGVS